MPQKRNPDAAELIRAKPGRIMGDMVALLTVLKGLPLAYGKDMQEDKEPVFDAKKSICISLMAMTGMIEDMTAHPEAMRQALRKGHPAATDLADYLVAELNIPFRDAHHITGALVALADEKDCGLDDLSLEELQSVEPQLTGAVQAVLSIDHAVAARTSYGGTAPEQVRARIAEARAQREVARAIAETTFERLAGDFAIARAIHESATTRFRTLSEELIPMLNQQASEVASLAELGEVDTLLLLETISRRFEAKRQALDLNQAILDAAIEMARLLGPGVPHLPAPVEPSLSEDSR